MALIAYILPTQILVSQLMIILTRFSMLGEVHNAETARAKSLLKVIDILDVAHVGVNEPLLGQDELLLRLRTLIYH
jgi:hypothetical protein